MMFVTDLGTTKLAQAIPGLEPDRFPWAYCFHDDAYNKGIFNVSTDQGQTWTLRTATERESNDRLKSQALADPGDPANTFEADAIWCAVESLGWKFWKKDILAAKLAFFHARKALKASRKYDGHIDPFGGGGIIRLA